MSDESRPTETPYDGIIPTGWLTAYGRTFSDIPYAQEIFDGLESSMGENPPEALDVMKDTELAPQFEARYKLLDRLIMQTGIRQILEVAAGLSSRGLALTEDDSLTYVELDLPHMMDDKRRIVKDLQAKRLVPQRANLHFEDGNAVEIDGFLNAAEHFDPNQPLLIVNEGLLRYLGLKDKQRYAANVSNILRKFGGTWVTSDISLPKVMYKEQDVMAGRRKKISEITGVQVDNNLFKDEEDAKQFFGDLGFSVKSHSFLEVIDELTSPAKLGMSRDYVEAINASPVCFVMRPKDES